MSTDTPQLDVGAVTCTPGAQRLLEEHARRQGLEQHLVLMHLISRHATHDWGTVDADDARANTRALIDGGRIISSYALDGTPVWVITEAEGDDGTRASTSVLLPEEY
jgi:hypothetical protein